MHVLLEAETNPSADHTYCGTLLDRRPTGLNGHLKLNPRLFLLPPVLWFDANINFIIKAVVRVGGVLDYRSLNIDAIIDLLLP